MSVPLTPSADKNWITACWACLEESMARSLTVISLLLQSTTHCRYWVYTKFLLTYTAIYQENRKVLPLGITVLQPQSHFHLGMPYILEMTYSSDFAKIKYCWFCNQLFYILNLKTLRMAYFTYFHSVIRYGIIFWGNATNRCKVFKLWKRVIRIVSGGEPRASCSVLFRKLEILLVPFQYILFLMLFIIDNPNNFQTGL